MEGLGESPVIADFARRKLQLLSENEAPGEERLDCSFPFCTAVIHPSLAVAVCLSTFEFSLLSSHPFTSIGDRVSAPVKGR